MSWYDADAMQRITDGERAWALTSLARHHRRGRIDGQELAERTDAARTARTRGDLTVLFSDLRGPRRSGPSALRRGFFRFPFLPILLVVGLVLAATGHVPWLALGIIAAVLVVTAPFRFAHRVHRGWGHGTC